MKEVIEEILLEEKTARERVEKAREDAKKIRLQAEEEAKQIVMSAQEEAQSEVKTLIEKMRTESAKEKEDALARAVKTSESLWDDKSHQISQTVSRLFQLITGKR